MAKKKKVTLCKNEIFVFILTAQGWRRATREFESSRKAMEAVSEIIKATRMNFEFAIGYHNTASNRWLMVAASNHEGPFSLPFDTPIIVI